MEVVAARLAPQETELPVLPAAPEELVGVVDARKKAERLVGHGLLPHRTTRSPSAALGRRASHAGRAGTPRERVRARTTVALAGWHRRSPPRSRPPRRPAWRGAPRPVGCAGSP